ncbi:unnamed protein product [Kuraishia capsulata CBS 1993]|uniref:Glutamate--cysteine ligase n=1 Tax=Kuraishia capsulata CBS 1993 TaxID=1382522 RepID=W6MFX2_9ASCO|nr:uncharacterized protein KUCA_T00000512001 [Kuraishia capsulata CBS 1993]CDK24546.1 unnamed protein product [Kuraishia capsulata CBS 1993]
MGLLSLGTPLHWLESRNHCEHVRDNGLEQLIKMFEAASARSDDPFLWGDEIEYMLLKVNDKDHSIKLAIDEDDMLERLAEDGVSYRKAADNDVSFHPEYGRYMIEATPATPYDGASLKSYAYVERNMEARRKIVVGEVKDKSVVPMTYTSFPRMGVGLFTDPPAKANGAASMSLFLPDEIINRHVRFPTLTANIRRRRGSKVAINIPLFKDSKTRSDSEVDLTIPHRQLYAGHDDEAFQGAAQPGSIYMDSMGFGMGSSCLQVTMQAPDVRRARYLYDSLVNIAPLTLALTAAAPIFRGFLADQDVRWNVISGAVDDRTPFERSEPPLPGHSERGNTRPDANLQRIPKSRYDSVDQYLGDIDVSGEHYGFFKEDYNDIESPINDKVYSKLQSQGFDPILAHHFAHLYIRDPIVIFNERIDQNNDEETDHFENIQSTNWQSLRFKPPTQKATPDNHSTPGWRVELRPMEISITDFENAAFAVFAVLLASAILKNNPNLYIPISLVDENMKSAHRVNAYTEQKFHMRTNIFEKGSAIVEELTLGQIFNGTDSFAGLIPLVETFVDDTFGKTENVDELAQIKTYLKFISFRSAGKIPSTAAFIRNFVVSHEDYKHDSVVSDLITYDLTKKLYLLGQYDHDTVKEFFGEELGQDLIESHH